MITIALFVLMSVNEFLHHPSIAQTIQAVIVALVLGLAMYRGMNENLRYGILVILCTTLLISIPARKAYYEYLSEKSPGTHQDSWSKLVDWIRSSNIHGIFLIPINEGGSDRFQLMARRKVWVDWKQGAAVMWSPSFYDQWMVRYKQVSVLNTPEEFIDYAQAHNIRNVIIKSQDGACPAPALPIKATERYVLCQL
ncbi:MAG: hypothetical protein NDI90_00470 [Nitrospira sp. BO4]|jgi:hypothetical protein|nr:hypothetical protein [Nitrospira sp. BO4]